MQTVSYQVHLSVGTATCLHQNNGKCHIPKTAAGIVETIYAANFNTSPLSGDVLNYHEHRTVWQASMIPYPSCFAMPCSNIEQIINLTGLALQELWTIFMEQTSIQTRQAGMCWISMGMGRMWQASLERWETMHWA